MKATIILSSQIPKLIKRSLEPELKKVSPKKVEEKINCTKNNLTVELKSDDLNALKAALNSYLSLIKTASEFGGEKWTKSYKKR